MKKVLIITECQSGPFFDLGEVYDEPMCVNIGKFIDNISFIDHDCPLPTQEETE